MVVLRGHFQRGHKPWNPSVPLMPPPRGPPNCLQTFPATPKDLLGFIDSSCVQLDILLSCYGSIDFPTFRLSCGFSFPGTFAWFCGFGVRMFRQMLWTDVNCHCWYPFLPDYIYINLFQWLGEKFPGRRRNHGSSEVFIGAPLQKRTADSPAWFFSLYLHFKWDYLWVIYFYINFPLEWGFVTFWLLQPLCNAYT